MRKFVITLFSVFFVFSAYADEWNIAKSTHFIVHYKNATEDFISRLTEKAEGHYNDIAEALGFMRYDFWLWDNRANIYVYDDKSEYQKATGQPGWSGGCAMMSRNQKAIQCFPYEQGFFESVLPHEMAHLVFKEFVGFGNPAVPYWLDEGVASYQESLRVGAASRVIQRARSQNRFMNLEALFNCNPYNLHDSELVSLFYAEAVSLVDFLIKEFGKENFVVFCQNLRDKKDFQRALSSVYPFSNIQELDQAWRKHLGIE